MHNVLGASESRITTGMDRMSHRGRPEQGVTDSITSVSWNKMLLPLRSPEMLLPLRAPEMLLPLRAPEMLLPLRAPEMLLPLRAPEMLLPLRAPEIFNLGNFNLRCDIPPIPTHLTLLYLTMH